MATATNGGSNTNQPNPQWPSKIPNEKSGKDRGNNPPNKK
jgi:hypothetical protein